MSQKFWNDKKILVTGHTGFKGGWLCLMLKKLGCKITGYSIDIPTTPSLYKTVELENEIKSVFGDIRNYDSLLNTILESKSDIVFHLAAQSLVQESYKNPMETFSTNIMGTVNVLEAIRNSESVKAAVIVTSDKCYEIQNPRKKLKETDPMGGFDPYSSSKGCSELIISSFRKSFFNFNEYDIHKTSIASVRAGNVIGGGDWAKDRIIPDIIRSAKNKIPIKIRNPQAIRHWQHVLDPLNGYIMLAEKLWENGPNFSEAWNFGPTYDAKPVSWILEKFTQYWGEKLTWEQSTNDFKYESSYLELDSTKAQEQLGWYSKLNLEKTVMLTVSWYRDLYEGKNMKDVTNNQISNFLSSM